MDELNNYELQNREYSKEEYAEYKKNEKQQVYAMIDVSTNKAVSNSNEFKKYLDTQSKFEQYSVGNALLIATQMPESTQLRDYESWKNNGAYLKKYSKAIKILEPGDEYMREDGTITRNYNVKNMYDISQVSSKSRPKQMKFNDKILLQIFLNSSSAKIKVVDTIQNTDRKALYDPNENTLFITRGSGAETPAIFYEVAEELSKQEIGADPYKNYCVSYMLCKKYGIDVSRYNFDKVVATLNGRESKEIRDELDPINKSMKEISDRISEQVQSLTKESKSKETKNRENVR